MDTTDSVSATFTSALIVGTIRNGSASIEEDLQVLLDSLNLVLPTVALVVESDSHDGTQQVLENLAARDSRINFISLGNMEPKIPDRIARLRYCRNIYVREIRDNPILASKELIIVADLDGINRKITSKAIREAINSNFAWDVLTANQTGGYYDLLALRHPYWCPNNYLLEIEWFSKFISGPRTLRHCKEERMLKIPRTCPPIEVDSAFGGFGIYRKWIFHEFDYSLENETIVSEIDHVTLHRKAKARGAKIFIHPGLINSNINIHNLNGMTQIRRMNQLVGVWPFTLAKPTLRVLLGKFLRKS